MRRQLLATTAAIGTTLAVGIAVFAVPAIATHVTPVTVPGNPTCSTLAPGTTELKVDPGASGTFDDGTLFVTITVHDTAMGPTFDWSSNLGVDAVFAKGGSEGGNLYVYDPEAIGDTGLHTPVTGGSGKWAGLSHISFCYDEDDSPPPTNGETTPPNGETTPPADQRRDDACRVPTEVPAGVNGDSGSGSAGLVGLMIAGSAAAAGFVLFARRRALYDS